MYFLDCVWRFIYFKCKLVNNRDELMHLTKKKLIKIKLK